MRRTYLIDSENINDVWVELLQVLEDEDEILVFYTDKSAHMGYDRIVCLMEQKRGTVHWIKCFEPVRQECAGFSAGNRAGKLSVPERQPGIYYRFQ